MVSSQKEARSTKKITVILWIASIVIFILFITRSSIAIEYMKKGLKLCAGAVIPSLFPFMVISELLVSCGLLTCGRRGRFSGIYAFVLGIICGFPIGARTVCAMVDRGEITPYRASRILTFCNNPGSAFVISAVGVSLFGSARLGIILYVCVILSAIVVGMVGGLFVKSDEWTVCVSSSVVANESDVAKNFTHAIQSSAAAMLTVCAFVTFFSSLLGCLGSLLEAIGSPTYFSALIFAVFEISNGVGMAAEIGDMPSIILAAAALGWSGLSVHFQIMAVSSGRGISFKPYFIAKACQGVLCAAMAVIAMKFLPFSSDVFNEISTAEPFDGYRNAAWVCSAFFFVSISPIFVNKTREKQCKKSK